MVGGVEGGDPLQVISLPSIHQVLQEQLRRYIVSSGLKPGDRLPSEALLAKKTGSSRSAVREALRGLEALGLVEAHQGSGWYVRAFDLQRVIGGLSYSLVVDANSLEELLEVRAVLEESFLPQAIRALRPEDVEALQVIVVRMRAKAEAGEPFAEEDMTFHRTLFARCDNRVLRGLLELFWGLFLNALDQGMKRSEDPLRTVAFHAEIAQAAARGDARAAGDLLGRHFEDVKRRLVARSRV